jgi:hypothetical protein
MLALLPNLLLETLARRAPLPLRIFQRLLRRKLSMHVLPAPAPTMFLSAPPTQLHQSVRSLMIV